MPVACSGSLKDASAVVKTDINELFVVCREVDRNLLLYFWEIVSNLLTRAATCEDVVLGIAFCEKIKIATNVKNPMSPKIAMIILVFLSKPSAGGGVAI